MKRISRIIFTVFYCGIIYFLARDGFESWDIYYGIVMVVGLVLTYVSPQRIIEFSQRKKEKKEKERKGQSPKRDVAND